MKPFFVFCAGVCVVLLLSACGGGSAAPDIAAEIPPEPQTRPPVVYAYIPNGGTECRRAYAPVLIPENNGDLFSGKSQIGRHMLFHRPDFAVLRKGATVTVNYRFLGARAVHDHLDWFKTRGEVRAAVQPGDVIKIIKVKSEKSGFVPGDEYVVLADRNMERVNAYSRSPEGLRNENRYLATLAAECGEAAAAGQFVADTGGADAYISGGGFLFHDNGRRLMDESHALRLGNFLFYGDSDAEEIKAERRFTAAAGRVSLRLDSGWQRRPGGTDFFYGQLLLEHKPAPDSALFLRAAAGEVSSDIYRDGSLSGAAAEARFSKFLRADGAAFVRMEKPFAQQSEWRVLSAVRFGEEDNFVRMDFYRNIKDNGGGARVLYRREF